MSNDYDQASVESSEEVVVQSEPEVATKKLTLIVIPDHNDEANVVPVLPLPSLRGQHLVDNGVDVLKGLWAMSDYAHSFDGQTSEFEYRLVEPASGAFPVSGRYQGWFYLKHPAPKPGHVKVEDRDLMLTFSPDDGDGFNVSGEGTNKFGKFNVYGKMSSTGSFQFYKGYKAKKHLGTPKVGRTPVATTIGSKPLTPGGGITPRESRVRKPSSVISGAFESDLQPKAVKYEVPPPPVVPTAAPTPRNVAVAPIPTPIVRDSGRAVRVPPSLQKCSDLLKELQKHNMSAYFLDPVDYVKLCIPDYPDIVREPMDFGTIQRNLDKLMYQSHEAFAEHVRLVFKNAITYNQRRDHPVHIAARELSNRFEERYRILISQSGAMADYETNSRLFAPGAGAQGSSKKSGKSRHSTGAGRVGNGPRDVFVPPALDVSMQTLLEMQRAMKEMQDELTQLRSQVRKNEITTSLEGRRVAAQDPMTMDEKQALVEKINRLDEERMREVILVVQELFPQAANAENDEVDIPIDDLDTYTLRRLQELVQKGEKGEKRKRAPSSVPKQPGVKRSKSASAAVAGNRKSQSMEVFSAPIPVLGTSTTANSNAFFGGVDDDMLNGEEPVSMDTALPNGIHADGNQQWTAEGGRSRGFSIGGDDYSDLILEASEGNQVEIIVQNPSAWGTNAPVESNGYSAQDNSATTGWGEETMKEQANNKRLESVRKEEEIIRDYSSKNVEKHSFPRSDIKFSAVVDSPVDHESALMRRREDERKSRLEMGRTVNLDQHREALFNNEDMA